MGNSPAKVPNRRFGRSPWPTLIGGIAAIVLGVVMFSVVAGTSSTACKYITGVVFIIGIFLVVRGVGFLATWRTVRLTDDEIVVTQRGRPIATLPVDRILREMWGYERRARESVLMLDSLNPMGPYLDLQAGKKRVRIRLEEFGGEAILSELREKNPLTTPYAAVYRYDYRGDEPATLLFKDSTYYVDYDGMRATIATEQSAASVARLRIDDEGRLVAARLGDCAVAAGSAMRVTDLDIAEEAPVNGSVRVGSEWVIGFSLAKIPHIVVP